MSSKHKRMAKYNSITKEDGTLCYEVLQYLPYMSVQQWHDWYNRFVWNMNYTESGLKYAAQVQKFLKTQGYNFITIKTN